MIGHAQGFHAIGFDLYGNVTGELRLSQVKVTKNLNAPDSASLMVLLDERWGPPVQPTYEPMPGGELFNYLQPWAACIGIFDSETDEVLFYGPVVKRRRVATQGGVGWSNASMELDCQSWDFWLQYVFPELELVWGGADGQTAEAAITRVLWDDKPGLAWDETNEPHAWRVKDSPATPIDEAMLRRSVAGRAGVAFRLMPIDRVDFPATTKLVHVDWSTTGPDKLGQTSASALIAEVVEQGVDFSLSEVFTDQVKMTVTPVVTAAPDWGTTPPTEVLALVAGGNVAEATVIDRGDLFASLVRVSGGSGTNGEFPAIAQTGNEAERAKLLVERSRPYQKSGGFPTTASLNLRAEQVQRVLAPSPFEVNGIKVNDRLPTLRPGDAIVFMTPKGSDPATPDQEWEVLGRIQSISWGSDLVGCEITLVEPGAEAAAAIPRPSSLTGMLSGLEADVTGLMLR